MLHLHCIQRLLLIVSKIQKCSNLHARCEIGWIERKIKFLIFILRVMVIFMTSLLKFSMNFHNFKNKNRKIDFSFVSAHCTSSMKTGLILRGGGSAYPKLGKIRFKIWCKESSPVPSAETKHPRRLNFMGTNMFIGFPGWEMKAPLKNCSPWIFIPKQWFFFLVIFIKTILGHNSNNLQIES